MVTGDFVIVPGVSEMRIPMYFPAAEIEYGETNTTRMDGEGRIEELNGRIEWEN